MPKPVAGIKPGQPAPYTTGEAMAIRLRTVNGIRVALCAAETDEEPEDVYLHDGEHYALAAKFRQDWHGETNETVYKEEWAAMATQKKRDAKEELEKWLAQQEK
jgi:hypothetical protein